MWHCRPSRRLWNGDSGEPRRCLLRSTVHDDPSMFPPSCLFCRLPGPKSLPRSSLTSSRSCSFPLLLGLVCLLIFLLTSITKSWLADFRRANGFSVSTPNVRYPFSSRACGRRAPRVPPLWHRLLNSYNTRMQLAQFCRRKETGNGGFRRCWCIC